MAGGLPDGVPALLDAAVQFLDPTNLLTGDNLTGYGYGQPPQWGIFLNGVPVVIADTVTDFGYQQDWAISDYPVEGGGFESYDKVNNPFRVRVQFVKGGGVSDREALLDSVAAIGDTLTLYDVVTPEAIYTSTNVEHYDYRRTARNGLGLMIVEVHMIEIRQDPGSNFQNTASPSGFAAQQQGTVQPQTPTQAVPEGIQ